jgi:hypothetical protein
MKKVYFKRNLMLIMIVLIGLSDGSILEAQCPEYTAHTYSNPSSCEDIEYLDDNYNVSIYDGCKAEIVLDLTHYPTIATNELIDTMIIKLYSYYNDTKTEIMYDPRVDYYNLAHSFDGDMYKDFGFVQDSIYEEEFYFYQSGTSLSLDTLLDMTPKLPAVDSNDMFIIFMEDLELRERILNCEIV